MDYGAGEPGKSDMAALIDAAGDDGYAGEIKCDTCLHDINEYHVVECDNCDYVEIHCQVCAVSKIEHYTTKLCGIFRSR